jgi:hypothetical protein
MPSDAEPSGARRHVWRALALALCALLLASVARFYHPAFGFSALLIIPQGHDHELPALQQIPHYEYPPQIAYDGALYVQLAMEPLLRDPAIDRALDAPAYRARRILFCWTAYALGLGKPAWILQAFALQNVLSWLMLAWLITRWFPLSDARFFALWVGSMFSHGLLMSVRMSLLDGPSLLLIACAVLAAERGHRWVSAAVLGIAGLGRETNLLGAVALPWPSGWRGWAKTAAAGLLVVLPLVVWQDYIWSIYRGTSTSAGADQLTVPLAAYAQKWRVTFGQLFTHGVLSPAGYTVLALIALTVQVLFLVWTRAWRDSWWRLALAFGLLILTAHWVVWEGYPGAVTRVALPLKLGFNVLLARHPPRFFWAWLVAGNLDLVAAHHSLPIIGLPIAT